jgi:hypothetical protein
MQMAEDRGHRPEAAGHGLRAVGKNVAEGFVAHATLLLVADTIAFAQFLDSYDYFVAHLLKS